MNKSIYPKFAISILLLIIAACNNNSVEFPGYVEGQYIYISSPYSGLLYTLNVRSGDVVSKNQALYSLDPYPEQDELLEAQARTDQAKAEEKKMLANYNFQKSIYDRKKGLFKKKVISQEEFDSATSQFQQADSGWLAAQSNIQALSQRQKKIVWVMKQKKPISPSAGIIFDVFYKKGENVPNNSPVLALLPSNAIKIIFYCPEMMLGQIKLNQVISVDCDICSGPIDAKITYISTQAEFTPPVLYSKEVRSKLSYRIEALPLSTEAIVLHPGEPITVRLKA